MIVIILVVEIEIFYVAIGIAVAIIFVIVIRPNSMQPAFPGKPWYKLLQLTVLP